MGNRLVDDPSEDSTVPGRPRSTDGPPEARLVSELAIKLHGYSQKLNIEAMLMTRRQSCPPDLRKTLALELREVADLAEEAASELDPRPDPEPDPTY